MHLSFLKYIACPISKKPLTLAKSIKTQGDFVIEGELSSGTFTYPIKAGIPRFVGQDQKNYADSFGYQWKKWSKVQFESENAGRPMQGHTLRMFEKIIGVDCSDFSSKIILDVGCGPGRFLDIVRSKNGKAIGIDYSSVVDVAGKNFLFDENVLICQADALSLPIAPRSVDGAYSIGVLHHTPDPKKGFFQMVDCVREGGWAAVSVYPKGGYYDALSVQIFRKIFSLLKPVLGYYPPLIYSYFAAFCLYPMTRIRILGFLLQQIFPMVSLPDLRWRVLDTFDSITPAYQSAHESHEVFSWFKEAGMREIEPSDWGSASYHGIAAEKVSK